MLEVLSVMYKPNFGPGLARSTYERTFEKSLEGDIMKLSAEFDHEIKCCML